MHYKGISIAGFITVIVIVVLIGLNKNSESSIVSRNENIYAVGVDHNIIYHDLEKEYDIVIDSFQIAQNIIKKNYNLARLLTEAGITSVNVGKATNKSSDVFNIQNIKAGNPYRLYYTRDSSKTLRYFVYKHSPTEFLKISFNNEPIALRGEKEVVNVRKVSTGTISSSLWATMIENDLDPMMAIRLSEIYAWTVDFFGLEKGDHFKVIYDEQFVDSIPIGIGQIYAAAFNHKGEDLMAYSFEQDGVQSYYDENGKSLRRQFLKAPLKFSRISSGYTNSRMHPILKIKRPHHGVDYAAPRGTPIYSIGDGTVIQKGYTTSAGNYIKIRHNSIYTSGYNHLSAYAKGIKTGQRVSQGQLLGYVGSTGYATGPHLDFRLWQNNHPVDPLKVKAPPVEPVKEENLPNYQASIKRLVEELNSSN